MLKDLKKLENSDPTSDSKNKKNDSPKKGKRPIEQKQA